MPSHVAPSPSEDEDDAKLIARFRRALRRRIRRWIAGYYREVLV